MECRNKSLNGGGGRFLLLLFTILLLLQGHFVTSFVTNPNVVGISALSEGQGQGPFSSSSFSSYNLKGGSTTQRFKYVSRVSLFPRKSTTSYDFIDIMRNKRNNIGRKQQTQLYMYDLPPGGGGGGRRGNELEEILKLAAGFGIFALVMSSPLGGIIAALFNSFLFLIFVIPLVGVISYQAYIRFSTIEGQCPNCSAPARVPKSDKDGNASPSICFNCGAILQANYDNTGIDNITGRRSMSDDFGGSMGGGNTIFDLFNGMPMDQPFTTSSTSTTIIDDVFVEQKEEEEDIMTSRKENKQFRRQKKNDSDDNDIIDVEIER